MSRPGDLKVLCQEIVSCRLCPRLVEHRERVAREKRRAYKDWSYWGKPVPGFGDPNARLLIVGLAPAAHGGNRTGRVFTGDSSGNWLYEALHRFDFASQPSSVSRDDGLELIDCYVTASARCAPPGNKPTPRELENCRPYLVSEIRLLRNLKVVLALGRIGFTTYLRVAGAARATFGHGRETTLPGGIVLLSSYHPSRQN